MLGVVELPLLRGGSGAEQYGRVGPGHVGVARAELEQRARVPDLPERVAQLQDGVLTEIVRLRLRLVSRRTPNGSGWGPSPRTRRSGRADPRPPSASRTCRRSRGRRPPSRVLSTADCDCSKSIARRSATTCFRELSKSSSGTRFPYQSGADHMASTSNEAIPFGASAMASGRYCVRFVVSGSPSQCTHSTPANGPTPSGTTRYAFTSAPEPPSNSRSTMVVGPRFSTPTVLSRRSAAGL